MPTNGPLRSAGMVGANLIYKDGKYLLVQEKKERARGLWNLPAGKVEEGYSIEETAVKEAKEETGYDVRLVRKIAIYQNTAEEFVKHVFHSEITGGELYVPEDEILDAKWFSLEELKAMQGKLRSPWVLQAVELFDKERGS